MNHPLDWKIDYCLKHIEEHLDKTTSLQESIFWSPSTELTFEEKWLIRETLQNIRCQVKILQYDIKQLEENPPKKKFIKRLMRK